MVAGPGNTAPALTSVTIFFFCWAVITFALRLWVKLPKRTLWGLDHPVIGFALVAALANVITTCFAVNHDYGLAWSSLSEPSSVDKLTRISNSLFTARFITHDKSHVRLANILVGAQVAWIVGSLFTIAIRDPIRSPWRSRDGTETLFTRWLVVESLGCALDLAVVVFSAYLSWNLQMPRNKKGKVAAIFASRLLIWPILACRLWKLSPSSRNADPDSPNIQAQVLTQIAMETALNLGSVTCLTPFLRPFQESGYIRSASQDGLVKYGITGAIRSGKETYMMLGTPRSTTRTKDGSIVQASTDKELQNY